MMRQIEKFLFVLLLVLASPAFGSGTNGTYQSGSYRIDVVFGTGTLTVTEPNKTSIYHQRGDAYHFTNPVNGISYSMKVIDARALLAFKPGRESAGTRLDLVRAAASSTPSQPAANAAQVNHLQIAERYKALAQEDRIKAQIWSACSAAALGHAQKPRADAREYARRTASMLKTIMLYPEKTPCADAISVDVWKEAQ